MIKKITSILLVIIWMTLIFIMSSFNSVDSSNQSNFIVEIICNIFNIKNIEILSIIIRKTAHFTEYFILGLFVYNMVHTYNKKIYLAIIICVLYAISDEIHQIFVPGRQFKIIDICIDSIASILSISILNIKNKINSKKL